MDPSLNTNKLGYDTQRILLQYVPNELREDLRQIQGIKRMSDAVPLTFKKVYLKGDESEVIVKFHERGTDNVQMWKIIPGEMICSWVDGLETELSTKTTVFTNCSVFEKLNELLCHFLDTEGTIVDLLDLDMLPRGIEFSHLIQVFKLCLCSEETDLSLLAAIQQPIEEVVILHSVPERDTQCFQINSAKNIKITDDNEFEKYYLYTPDTSLDIKPTTVHPQAVISLIKRFTRQSRPSGFQVTIDVRSKARTIVETILADKTYGWKETQFENKNCHFIERNGQNIVLYYESGDIQMHFINRTSRRDIPTLSGARNQIAPTQPIAEKRNIPTSSGARNQIAPTQPVAITGIPTSSGARNPIASTQPIAETNIPTSSGTRNPIASTQPMAGTFNRNAASEPLTNQSNTNLSNTVVQKLEINCDNGKANQVTFVGEEAVKTSLSGFGPKTVHENLTIKGFCEEPLFDRKLVRVNNLTLLSEVPYPASFFEQFADEEFNLMTVSSEKILVNDHRLRRNAKKVICLDTSSSPSTETVVQTGRDDEPPQKTFKTSS